ncbi:MAG: hypothetical protein WHS77_08720 [Brevinematales bacterium]
MKRFFLFILIFLFFCGGYAQKEKKYSLLYFKFYPVDLKVKVFIDNRFNLTEAEKAGYYISQINNGEAKIFLVNFSNLERFNNGVNYQYRIAFYRVYGENEILVYSFKVSFEADKVKIKYDNMNEKEFFKDVVSDSYLIKDINGNDFNLTEKMRKVKIRGKIKEIDKDGKVSFKDLNEEIKFSLIRKVDDENFALDKKITLTLGKEFIIGHYPYELIFDNTQKFKPVSLLLKNDEESKNLLIHFGEIWDNPYEYTVIFERNKDVFEILANDNYEYYYKIGKNKFKKADNLILNVKNYTNEIFYLRLASRSKALKWLKNSVYNISFKVSFDKSVKDLTDELVSSNFIFTKVDDWTLFINPDFKSTPFAIFCYPENAEITIERIEPLYGDKITIFKNSPVFFNDFIYGKYRITADWYSDDKVLLSTDERIVEIDDLTLKKGKDIKFLSNNNVRIPYIFLEKKGEVLKNRDNYLKNIDLPYSVDYGYYVQIIAVDEKYKNFDSFTKNYLKKYRKLYNEDITLYSAEKLVRGKKYKVLVSGPYSKDKIERELYKNQRIIDNSFVVKGFELKNLKYYGGQR